jgi:membrane-associated phospholipid phosphatase
VADRWTPTAFSRFVSLTVTYQNFGANPLQAVCKPDVAKLGAQSGDGLGNIMYDRSVCTGKKSDIDDSLESFPSGHTTAAFGGFIFLYLYLNAKLKVWSNYHPAYWKLIVTYVRVLSIIPL